MKLPRLTGQARATRTWNALGQAEPFFGVLTYERYRSNAMDADALAEFRATGEQDISTLFSRIQQTFGIDTFRPERALEFGCGVGRQTLALAGRAGRVVGVDVSEGMLEQARAIRDELGLPNVTLVRADDAHDLSRNLSGTFDLVHSYIVFQHMAPAEQLSVTQVLLDHVAPSGVVSLHYVYLRGRDAGAERWDRLRRARWATTKLAWQVRHPTRNAIEMNEVNLRKLLDVLHSRGFTSMDVELTDHGDERGLHLLARRSEADWSTG